MSISGINGLATTTKINGSSQTESLTDPQNKQDSYDSINNLTDSLLTNLSEKESDLTTPNDTQRVNLKETLLSQENIKADKTLLSEMNGTIKGLKGQDAVLDYLTEEALKYEFGKDTSLEDFTLLAENHDETSGFTFTTYKNGDQTITLFSKYDETDKHAELGIYRDDGSTTKFDYSGLNNNRGISLQHTSDFYNNDDGEKEREFALIYDDKSFTGRDYKDNETGLWQSESFKDANDDTLYKTTTFNNGDILIDAYDTETTKLVNVQVTNDIGTVVMNTDASVRFTTGQNHRDDGNMQFLQYDENGKEIGYAKTADKDVNKDIYQGSADTGEDVNYLRSLFNKYITEKSHLNARIGFEGEEAGYNFGLRLLLDNANSRLIEITDQLGELE